MEGLSDLSGLHCSRAQAMPRAAPQLELETIVWSAVSLFPVGRGGARRQPERDREEERCQQRPL
jgi:hypothetical protein